jgi:hypothetical protein
MVFEEIPLSGVPDQRRITRSGFTSHKQDLPGNNEVGQIGNSTGKSEATFIQIQDREHWQARGYSVTVFLIRIKPDLIGSVDSDRYPNWIRIGT